MHDHPMGKVFFDNTLLTSYKDCPRKFFLRHRLSLTSSGSKDALDFGLAWHGALENLWISHSPELASQAFLKVWTEECARSWPLSIPDQERLGARTPQTAFAMIESYMKDRRSLMESHKVIGNEQKFAVRLCEDLPPIVYIGRLDKVLQSQEGDILVLEHKTTSAYSIAKGFQDSFVESWCPNSQIDGYQYVMSRVWPDRHTKIMVDASLVHKKERRNILIPVQRNPSQIESWRTDAMEWIKRLTTDEIWPQNTGSCMNYMTKCQFYDVCRYSIGLTPDMNVWGGHLKTEIWEPYDTSELLKAMHNDVANQLDIWEI